MTVLDVRGVTGGYGEVTILRDVSLALEEGSTTCVVGANGAGKTTLVRAIMGQVRSTTGTVTYDGRDVTSLPTHRKAGLGLILVPEGRQLFSSLTVRENLNLGATPARAGAHRARNFDWVLSLFPRLEERLEQQAGTLSGGEQQMLAVGRGLMAEPRLLMLDEPSLGLAPVMVQSLYGVLRQLQEANLTILLVEQNVPLAMSMSRRAYVLSEGRVVLNGEPAELQAKPEMRKAYLGV
jgi:branched-chain amino acid transport system ATP-binding protein